MARSTAPVPAPALAADHATVIALQGLADYQPTNPDCSVAQLLQLQASLTQAEQAEADIESALAQARRVRAETSHRYHDCVVLSRTQVQAQYGPDSIAVERVGLTRKSNRKRPTRRTAKTQ
jgi:hypothetical protein